jgi:hypothetical protein
MDSKQKEQLEQYLSKFVEKANSFFASGDYTLSEYWKGQVMGICKVITVLKLDDKINTSYYLNRLH